MENPYQERADVVCPCPDLRIRHQQPGRQSTPDPTADLSLCSEREHLIRRRIGVAGNGDGQLRFRFSDVVSRERGVITSRMMEE